MKYPVSVSCRKGSFATVQRMAIGIGAYSTYGSRVRYLSLLVSGMFGPHQGQRGGRERESSVLRPASTVDTNRSVELVGRVVIVLLYPVTVSTMTGTTVSTVYWPL